MKCDFIQNYYDFKCLQKQLQNYQSFKTQRENGKESHYVKNVMIFSLQICTNF